MASVQDLKRRIQSVRNTRKITRAMELVAAAKLRRAELRIKALRPYAETMNELIAGVGRASSSVRLPLLEQREDVETVAIVPLTGDRGLAGAFNAQILRRAFALERSLQSEEEGPGAARLRGDFISEPARREIMARLLPVYVETQIYRALLESTASEQGARMTAMRNASKNAGDLIDSLTLSMNRARQAEITQEILEVVAGAEALA